MEGRDRSLDVLKGLAAGFMVQVHAMQLLARPDVAASPLGKVSYFLGGAPCAPVFMVVMGYHLARREEGLAERGLKLLALGLLLNLVRPRAPAPGARGSSSNHFMLCWCSSARGPQFMPAAPGPHA